MVLWVGVCIMWSLAVIRSRIVCRVHQVSKEELFTNKNTPNKKKKRIALDYLRTTLSDLDQCCYSQSWFVVTMRFNPDIFYIHRPKLVNLWYLSRNFDKLSRGTACFCSCPISAGTILAWCCLLILVEKKKLCCWPIWSPPNLSHGVQSIDLFGRSSFHRVGSSDGRRLLGV